MKPLFVDRHRPSKKEYPPFYAGYVDLIPKKEANEIIHSQMDRLKLALSGLSEKQSNYRYKRGKWSIKQVIRHIADSERIFAYRMLCFSRSDKGALPGFDQNAYAKTTPVRHVNLIDLIYELNIARQSTLAMASNFSNADWKRSGTANKASVSVRALFFITAGHTEHHISILENRYLPGLS